MKWSALVAALLVCVVYNDMAFSPLVMAAPKAHLTSGEQAMAQGWQAWQRGAFAEAVRAWLAAADYYARARQPQAQSTALTHLAQAYKALGQYRQTLHSLTTALQLAQQTKDRRQVAIVFESLGQTYLITGPPEAAHSALQNGLQLAREMGHAGLIAALLNDLGNVFASQRQYGEALDAYLESVQRAEQSGARALAGRALTNAAVASTQQGQSQAARAQLDRAREQMQGVEPSHDTAYDLINIGLAYANLRPALPEAHARLTVLAGRPV